MKNTNGAFFAKDEAVWCQRWRLTITEPDFFSLVIPSFHSPQTKYEKS